MESHHMLVAHLTAVLLAFTIAGMLLHRRHRLCRSFLVYLVYALVANRLVVTWPAVFYTPTLWALGEIVYRLLELAVLVEVAALTFSELPRARRQVLGALALLVGIGVAAQTARQPSAYGDWLVWLTDFIPAAQVAMLGTIAAFLMVAVYYRVPPHPFHRALLLGFCLFMVSGTVASFAVETWGRGGYPYYAALAPAAYAGSVGVWAWASWSRLPAVTRLGLRIHPWAAASW